jgi:hypothetical protein
MQAAALLREDGIPEHDIARQVLSGEPVSKAEFDAAKQAKQRLLGDQDFVRRYLSGDGEAKRQMALLNVVITRDIKETAA